jgi:hypothetical protein
MFAFVGAGLPAILGVQRASIHAPGLRAKTQARYQDKAIAFRTLLETV